VRGTKDIKNITICKLIINKQENTCSGVYWNDIGLPGPIHLHDMHKDNSLYFISEKKNQMGSLASRMV
jgi:hypothetical protein